MTHFKKLQKFTFTVFLSLLFFLASCSNSPDQPSNPMAFENVEYISSFPLNFSVESAEKVPTNNVGLRRFRIIDSLLILDKPGTHGFWNIFKLPEYEKGGAYLNKGDGPLEFMQSPSVAHKNTFREEKSQLIAYLYDFQKGRVLRFNISESISNSRLELTEYYASLPPYSFTFAMLEDSTFYVKNLGNKDTQQLRSVVHADTEEEVPEIFSQLNEASIQEGEDFNILSTMTLYSEQNQMIVEMPIGLNNINMYRLNGTFAKSICIGEELSDLNKIQEESRADRKYTFADLRLFDDFFGAVYINEGEKSYQLNRRKKPSILLFDWEGKPLAEIKTNHHFTSFDIDFVNQELYTFDLQTDEFLKYDIKKILSKMEQRGMGI